MFSCFSTYELQHVLHEIISKVVSSVPESNLKDFAQYASTVLGTDVSYDFETILDYDFPPVVSSTEQVVVYLEDALYSKCQSRDIFRLFPKLDSVVNNYCNENTEYDDFIKDVIRIVLQRLYDPIVPTESPTQTSTRKRTQVSTHLVIRSPTHAPTRYPTRAMIRPPPTQSPTHEPTQLSSSSSLFKTSMKCTLAIVTVLYIL